MRSLETQLARERSGPIVPVHDQPAVQRSQDVQVGPQGSPLEWDFFLSHASADKDAVAKPLADGLQKAGATVWYDDFVLRVGDDLRAKIDGGLANSRFGVVILSEAFLSGRPWTDAELAGLFARDARILPIWHKVSREEVASYSPIVAGRVALQTSLKTTAEIVEDLLALLHE